jgi:ABC-2 type transport system ATP-binding protein
LDPAETRDVRNILNEMKREKLIFMSSHLLYEVTEIADKVVFLNNGKLLLIDTVQGITEKFSDKEGMSGLEDAYVKLVRGEAL